MKAWLAQRNPREQLSLLVLCLVLSAYLVYMLAWRPLAEMRDGLAAQNRAEAARLQRVDALASEVINRRDSGAVANRRGNLASIINQSTGRLQLQVSRLQPNARGDIQVRLENAVFDDVLAWLYEMEYREGLLVREVSITRAGPAGHVNATVRIAQAV